MEKAQVIDLKFCELNKSNNKKNRYIIHIKYCGTIYYLDVTDELKKNKINLKEENFNILKQSLPESIYASFFDEQFKISKESMDLWIKNYNEVTSKEIKYV